MMREENFSFVWANSYGMDLDVHSIECVDACSAYSPTSPNTVHSSRFPHRPGLGPLGATASSVAGSAGIPGADLGNGPWPLTRVGMCAVLFPNVE